MSFRQVERGGEYGRVADPSWADPLDGSYAGRRGGRWNPPGSFPVVYLNRDRATARLNVARKFAGLPYGPEDVDPREAPVLAVARVPDGRFVDVVTDDGCRAAGPPASYPVEGGRTVPWERCRPIGQAAWDAEEPGIACRSAAPGAGRDHEELAWFARGEDLTLASVEPFESWFWPASGGSR